jgi:hypothetical protein
VTYLLALLAAFFATLGILSGGGALELLAAFLTFVLASCWITVRYLRSEVIYLQAREEQRRATLASRGFVKE